MKDFGLNENDDIVCSSFLLLRTGLSPIGTPSFEQWEEVGRFIKKATNACTLWLGDWINYGKGALGEKYLTALRQTGLDYGTLRNAAYTARKINLSDRSDKLGYKHHELVASLPKECHRELLQEAERKRLSIRELQHKILERKKTLLPSPALPAGVYQVIYADPPWEIESLVFNKWRNPLPYPTMSIDELKAMALPAIADDSVLFLWTTLTTLPQALELLTAWRFQYHITITWDKGNGWCMSGFHRKSELVLVGYRGIIGNVIKQEGAFMPTVFYEPKTTHSTKPQKMYELIEDRTVGNRIELFARTRRDGWAAWGNEVELTCLPPSNRMPVQAQSPASGAVSSNLPLGSTKTTENADCGCTGGPGTSAND